MGGVVDEAHLIKNPQAKRTKFVLKMSQYMTYRLAMTGTPIGTGLDDLFSQYKFLDPNILGLTTATAFNSRYVVYDYNGRVAGYQNEGEMRQLVAPYTFAARKVDCLPDLPPVSYTRRYVELLPVQVRALKDIVAPNYATAQTPQDKMKALSALSRKQQIVEGYYGEIDPEQTMLTGRTTRKITWILEPHKSPKLIATVAAVGDINAPVIVWVKYRASLEALHDMFVSAFGTASTVCYYGETSQADRKLNMARFTSGRAWIFLATVGTAGTGLNGLTVASNAVYESNCFKAIARTQSVDRLHRPGAVNPILITDVVARNSLDEVILRALTNNQNLVTYLRTIMSNGEQT